MTWFVETRRFNEKDSKNEFLVVLVKMDRPAGDLGTCDEASRPTCWWRARASAYS